MNQLVPFAPSHALPALVTAAGDQASLRFLEFFAADIRNAHTRRVFIRAVADFLAWCIEHRVASIAAVQPLYVATWIEVQARELSALSVKANYCSCLSGVLEIGAVRQAPCIWQEARPGLCPGPAGA